VVKGLVAVAALVDNGAPRAACHCLAVPVTRPNRRVGSASKFRPKPSTDVATALICASVAPNWLAALSSDMKWRYCADPGVDTLTSVSSSAVVELGSDR
jgi:hypothetical protein